MMSWTVSFCASNWNSVEMSEVVGLLSRTVAGFFSASFASTLGLQQVVSKLCVCLQGPTSIDACGKLQLFLDSHKRTIQALSSQRQPGCMQRHLARAQLGGNVRCGWTWSRRRQVRWDVWSSGRDYLNERTMAVQRYMPLNFQRHVSAKEGSRFSLALKEYWVERLCLWNFHVSCDRCTTCK